MRAPGTSFTTPCPSLVACLLRREGGAIPSIAMPPHGESERATTPPTRTGKRVIHPSHERGSAQGNDTVVGGGYIHDSTRHILQSVHWSAAACPGGRTRGSSPALLLAGAVLRAHRVRRSHGVVTGNWRAWGWRVSSRHQQMHLRWHHRSSRTLCTHAPGDVARPRSAADRGELLRIGSGSLRNKAAAKVLRLLLSASVVLVVCPSLLWWSLHVQHWICASSPESWGWTRARTPGGWRTACNTPQARQGLWRDSLHSRVLR
jgi:hypothetical protein